jgi:hypothetical protein
MSVPSAKYIFGNVVPGVPEKVHKKSLTRIDEFEHTNHQRTLQPKV